jgi:hypothetical protein
LVYLWHQQARLEDRHCAMPYAGGRAQGINVASKAILRVLAERNDRMLGEYSELLVERTWRA